MSKLRWFWNDLYNSAPKHTPYRILRWLCAKAGNETLKNITKKYAGN